LSRDAVSGNTLVVALILGERDRNKSSHPGGRKRKAILKTWSQG